MDNIEITVFDEINDYKEKIYFFNLRQWIFAILIVALVVPTYIILKDKIGEDATSYVVIAIAGILGFIGFVKIHELPAEKILPYWFRHYFCFAKPIHYISDAEYQEMHQKKKRKQKKVKEKKVKPSKAEIKENKRNKKLEKKQNKENKKKLKKSKSKNTEIIENKENQKSNESELVERLSKLTKEQQEVLLKLLER